MATNVQSSVLVLACGNRRRGDDAFGAMVVDELRRMNIEGITSIDLGQRPDRLLDRLGGVQTLIVVDAIESESLEPGQIVELDWNQMRSLPDRPAGTHGFSVLAQLQIGDRLGLLPPDVALIGVAIGRTDREALPQPVVAACVPKVAERIVRRSQRDLVKARMTP